MNTHFTPVDTFEQNINISRNRYCINQLKSPGCHLHRKKSLIDHLVLPPPACEKVCSCGCQLKKIGEDISEQIERISEQVKVIEHVRPKYACPRCETVKAAEKPECPLPKCMATSGFITDVIIKKYEHHLPLYRQSKILLQAGLEIPDNTLGNWVMGSAEVLTPLGEALQQQFLKIGILQADETTVKVLKPDKEGYLWAYHSCEPNNRFIFFEFSLTRSGDNVNRRLKDYKGLLQTDGYSGYNEQRKKSEVINFGCWDPARIT